MSIEPRIALHSRLSTALRVIVLALAIAVAPLTAQSHSAFPIDLRPGPLPQPVTAGGRVHLVYELHITNAAPWPITLTGLNVLDGQATAIAEWDEDDLDRIVVPIERLVRSSDEANSPRLLASGHTAVIFCDLTLGAEASVPARLRHHLSFSWSGDNGEIVRRSIDGVEVPVDRPAVVVLQPPVRGSRWVAFNGLNNAKHRRAYNAVDGRMQIAERFAIDRIQLGPDGRLSRHGGTSNADFYSYGADLVAVADGRIVETKDGFADNLGTSERSARNVTLESIVGNYLILDIGGGRYALYAHLQPGSLRVKPGDLVAAGDVLARLGNSGNSDAPHLHFQVTDASSPLGAEGVPYIFASFEQLGVADLDRLEAGESWRPEPTVAPRIYREELPVDGAVVDFLDQTR